MKIPQIIHQTLSDKRHLPEEILKNIEYLKAQNPGWTHALYDDQDRQAFIREHYPREVLMAYCSINPLYGAARADLFRYLLMFKVGGVYLDIKSSCRVPFAQLIQDEDTLLLSHWNNHEGGTHQGWGQHLKDGIESEFQNWHIICAPHHPIIRAIIEAVLYNLGCYSMSRFGVGKAGVFRTTGPIVYTKTITPLLNTQPHRIIDAEAEGLVYSVFADSAEKKSHKALFRQHYRRLKMPIVSKGKYNLLHYLHYKFLRVLKLLP